jgi:hypothetical protein
LVLPFGFRDTHDDIAQHTCLASQSMVRLRQRFPIQQVLLVEIDLRKMLMPYLDLDAAGRAGGIPSTVVVQPKTHFLCRIKERSVLVYFSASSV